MTEWEEDEQEPSVERIEEIVKERGLATVTDTGAIDVIESFIRKASVSRNTPKSTA